MTINSVMTVLFWILLQTALVELEIWWRCFGWVFWCFFCLFCGFWGFFSFVFFLGDGTGHEDRQFEIEGAGCLVCSDRDLWVLLVALVTNCWLTFYK